MNEKEVFYKKHFLTSLVFDSLDTVGRIIAVLTHFFNADSSNNIKFVGDIKKIYTPQAISLECMDDKIKPTGYISDLINDINREISDCDNEQ
jgi:hypothetical protein